MLRGELRGNDVIVVSNREPYIHVRHGRRHRGPAAGERPRHRARADHARVLGHLDRARQRLGRSRDGRSPTTASRCRPEHPRYQIRRIWLIEGGGSRLLLRIRQRGPVAALPHRARAADVPHQRLASTTAASTRGSPTRSSRKPKTNDPIVLVQDYHFALLPRMIRERLPDATIITFWHIPWPNPEAFAICPWRERAARRPARQQHPRLPHAVPLQQFRRHRRPPARGARRPRNVHRLLPRRS